MKTSTFLMGGIAIAAVFMLLSPAWAQDNTGDNARPPMPPQGQPGGGHGPGLPAFEKFDANADGTVTFEEFSAALKKTHTEDFMNFDADGNGVLSKDELPKGPRPRPGSGPEGAGQGDAGRPPMPPGDRPGGGPGTPPPRPEDLDSDGDCTVTINEFSAAWAKTDHGLFTRLDADSDGQLSKEELAKARGPRHGRGGPGGPGHGQEPPDEPLR